MLWRRAFFKVFAINCLLENVDAEKCSKLDKLSFDGFKFLGKIVEPETTCNHRGYYTGEQ